MSWRAVGCPISIRLSSRSSAKMSLRNSSMLVPSGAPTIVAAGSVEHSLYDWLITGAAADVAAESIDHVCPRRVRVAVEESLCGHQHAGRAIAALGGEAFHECVLQRMQIGAAAESGSGLN